MGAEPTGADDRVPPRPCERAGDAGNELSAHNLDEHRMAEMDRMAPTHPHPHTPDSTLGATVAGAVSAVVDRARDAVREASDGG
jgi:hypothetical protein